MRNILDKMIINKVLSQKVENHNKMTNPLDSSDLIGGMTN